MSFGALSYEAKTVVITIAGNTTRSKKASSNTSTK